LFAGRRQDFKKKFDPANSSISVPDPTTTNDMVSLTPKRSSSSITPPTGLTTNTAPVTTPTTATTGVGLHRHVQGTRNAATANLSQENENDKHNTTTTAALQSEDAALSSSETSWAGDYIAPKLLERLRQTLHLTEEQMKLVLDTSRRQAMHNNTKKKDQDDSDYTSSDMAEEEWTPHQVLNRMIYVILMALLMYIANRDYGNVVTVWFITWFPREAATLGILTPLSSSTASSS
jgi:hypothetical protein